MKTPPTAQAIKTESEPDMTGQGFQKIEGESSLYRYHTGTIYLKTTVNGRSVQRSLKTKTLATAKRKAEDLKTQERRLTPDAGKMTFGDLMKQLETSKGGKNSMGFFCLNRKLENSALAQKKLLSVSEMDVKTFLNESAAGANTNNKFATLIKSAFRFAVRQKWILENPLDSVKLSKPCHRKKPFAPTPEQFEQLRESILTNKLNDDRVDAWEMVTICGYFGIYRAEAELLTWEDVNFTTKRIKVFRPKTNKQYQVPIFPYARGFLKDLWVSRGKPTSGKILKPKNPRKSITSACQRLKFHHFSIKAFRQMFVIRLYRQDSDPKQISSWIGHSDGGVLVLKLYSEAFTDADEEMDEKTIENIT